MIKIFVKYTSLEALIAVVVALGTYGIATAPNLLFTLIFSFFFFGSLEWYAYIRAQEKNEVLRYAIEKKMKPKEETK